MDAELLADVSHYHLTFADAYLAHLLSSVSKDAVGRLGDGPKSSVFCDAVDDSFNFKMSTS